MGGFAISALGIVRSTVDLDFLILSEDNNKVHNILESINYKCVFETENVSQYTSSSQIFGEIDFIHAFREASVQMLKRAIQIEIFGGKLKINVLIPEDIIGLKLQALINDEKRKNKEMYDIEAIMEYYGKNLKWDFVKEHYLLFNREDEFLKLKGKYDRNNQ